MAIILNEQITLMGKISEVKTFHPSGALSKEDRERAEKLDTFLEKEMPRMAERILGRIARRKSTTTLFKWHMFGKELMKIADNALVLPQDVKSGIIWSAVWQHLPASLKPINTKTEKYLYSKTRSKGRNHLSICYALGGYTQKEIGWIRRWDDWCQIYYRSGILEDNRVFQSLGEEIRNLKEYPEKREFRAIVSDIAHRFPQRPGHKVHTSVLDMAVIRQSVHDSTMRTHK